MNKFQVLWTNIDCVESSPFHAPYGTVRRLSIVSRYCPQDYLDNGDDDYLGLDVYDETHGRKLS